MTTGNGWFVDVRHGRFIRCALYRTPGRGDWVMKLPQSPGSPCRSATMR
ncbi:MAG: hypothetical protein QGF67_08740 [Lentisphaeria bacterium]|jgi:hypothetical protein|nr:hypothetical protein [Lentisphaeria bacterium]MDP7741513.1 hypothetical protein [Lentisphaeria bacterium]